MGKMQRTKGASYEREVCAKFSDALGIDVKRNIGQARDGGNDINVGPLVIECKRRATLTTLESWHAQASEPCGLDETAVVVARADNGKSFAILDLDDFIALVRTELLQRMGR